MHFFLKPWHVFLAALCGLVNHRQQQIIEFQNAQIEALMQKIGRKRILLNDNQRRVLAMKGRALGRKTLLELTTIVTPDTILRWHRQLVAKKWHYSARQRAVGRPRIRKEIVDAIVRLAKENPAWGYDRIQGALKNLGYHISDTTVANVLKDHGIQPAPERERIQSWAAFLRAHWETIFATDFTTVEVWTPRGLVLQHRTIALAARASSAIATGPAGREQHDRLLKDRLQGTTRWADQVVRTRCSLNDAGSNLTWATLPVRARYDLSFLSCSQLLRP